MSQSFDFPKRTSRCPDGPKPESQLVQMVAIFDASGHTGQFIITELLRRGLTPIAISRDTTRLATLLPADAKEAKFYLNDLNVSQII